MPSVLVEENQFLLLIDVPIQDRAQQIQIYQIINLPLTNLPSCVAALYTKNSREIDHLCELTTKAQLEIYLPIPLAPNVWAIISSPFKQQLPVTVICPTKPATSIHISPPIHVLKLEPACSATSQHFHLPPKYEDTHIMMNFSIYSANLDIIDISSALFRITQHIPSVQQQETLEKLAALPPVPIKRITMELMREVLQETLSSGKSFSLCPSFLMGCIGFIASIMSTVACITKKKVAAWKPPALTGFLSLCRKDKNNTKMDDEDMDRPIYRPSGIIPTVIRPQESHGLCVIPQPAQKKDHCKQSDQPNGVSDTSVGPKFYPEAGPGDAGKANDLS